MECTVLSQSMIASLLCDAVHIFSRHDVCRGLLNDDAGYSIAIVYLGETSIRKQDAPFAHIKRFIKCIYFIFVQAILIDVRLYTYADRYLCECAMLPFNHFKSHAYNSIAI